MPLASRGKKIIDDVDFPVITCFVCLFYIFALSFHKKINQIKTKVPLYYLSLHFMECLHEIFAVELPN